MSVESDFDALISTKNSTDSSMVGTINTQSNMAVGKIDMKWSFMVTVRTSTNPTQVAGAQTLVDQYQAQFDALEAVNNILRNKYSSSAKTSALISQYNTEKSSVAGYVTQKAAAQSNYNAAPAGQKPVLAVFIDKYADLQAIAEARAAILKNQIDAQKATLNAVS